MNSYVLVVLSLLVFQISAAFSGPFVETKSQYKKSTSRIAEAAPGTEYLSISNCDDWQKVYKLTTEMAERFPDHDNDYETLAYYILGYKTELCQEVVDADGEIQLRDNIRVHIMAFKGIPMVVAVAPPEVDQNPFTFDLQASVDSDVTLVDEVDEDGNLTGKKVPESDFNAKVKTKFSKRWGDHSISGTIGAEFDGSSQIADAEINQSIIYKVILKNQKWAIFVSESLKRDLDENVAFQFTELGGVEFDALTHFNPEEVSISAALGRRTIVHADDTAQDDNLILSYRVKLEGKVPLLSKVKLFENLWGMFDIWFVYSLTDLDYWVVETHARLDFQVAKLSEGTTLYFSLSAGMALRGDLIGQTEGLPIENDVYGSLILKFR